MMKERTFFYLVLLLLQLSCTRDKGKLIVPDTSCKIPEVVSFNNDVLPLFNQYCSTSGCHSGSQPQSNLNLEPSVAYTQIMNKRKGYIDTIHPTYSLLYAQMKSVSDPMPPTGNLDACKTELILKWIEQKAKNN